MNGPEASSSQFSEEEPSANHEVLSLPFDRDEEFPLLSENVYLDHAGSTLYARSQIDALCSQLQSNLFTNPHSGHLFSQNTAQEIAKVRNRILKFFHTDAAQYSVVFTSGATASMKLVAECFLYGTDGVFAHLAEIHTSVGGMREVARQRGAKVQHFHENDLEPTSSFLSSLTAHTGKKLVAFPGQCNFSGRKYHAAAWTKRLHEVKCKVFLDAAALVTTSPLDLSKVNADFVALSFYKIFGHPTGVGALLVRNSVANTLRKTYFGGGSVEMSISELDFHVPRLNITDRLEDGTVNFNDIIALNHGFDAVERVGGGMTCISQRVFSLARYTFLRLRELRHHSGAQVAEIYHNGNFDSITEQGGVVTFNLKRSDSSFVGYSLVEKVMSSFKVHLRTGCFCNTGACQKYLSLSAQALLDNFHAGHVCGDNVDLVNGIPTGAIRVSFGYMSVQADADAFLQVIRDVFVENSRDVSQSLSSVSQEHGELASMFIYPVKSCRGTRVKSWPVFLGGFLYDRTFFVQNSKGTSVTLKHHGGLSRITPVVDLRSHQMILQAPGVPTQKVDLGDLEDQEDMAGRICGRRVRAFDCGDSASRWLTNLLNDDVYSLLRCTNDSSSAKTSSAANSAPFLLICSASIQCLLDNIPAPHGYTYEDLTDRMRPNLVVDTKIPFEEDSWKMIRIGSSMIFEVVEKCSRCQMVNIDVRRNGERNKEPLQSIIRLRGKEMHFGILLRQLETSASDTRESGNTASVLTEGDYVQVLTREDQVNSLVNKPME
ncbi:hypothetical protein RvY_15813 [Ramazzottius varieornatus]|uniref:Molybdenum cofactor sulfurase n=1 Tax=Ramazzottius varieornatus TaxID=947166 RepID=A0A1D1VW94_RAMVA|nr:hypothetical protein RvY_15813 [Ramazzottius varieornatus]